MNLSFKNIDNARKLLGLGESADLFQIKEAYYKLAKRYHPDKCREKDKIKCENRFKEINKAYETIMAYCAGCEFSFRKEDVIKTDNEHFLEDDIRRFYEGWY